MKLLSSYIYLIPLIFCQNLCMAGDVIIKSNPTNAEIWVKSGPNKKGRKLGNTPYVGVTEDLLSTAGDGQITFFELALEGFRSREVTIISFDKNSDLKINLNLAPRPEAENIRKHDNLMANLFKVQKLIRSQNFSGAINMLEELSIKHRHFSIISELKGIAYYMSKDLEKSLSMFRLAFSQNPDNSDAYKMKVYLEKKLNIDAEGSKR